MTLFDAIILGLVEGITEFLPISSTGHLIITSALLDLGRTAEEKAAIDAFNIMIQGAAILAVVGVFWSRVKQMIAGVLGRDAAGLRLAVNLLIAFLPAAIIGVLINDWVKEQLFYAWPVTAALFLGGIVLLVLRRWQQRFFHQTTDQNDPEHKPDARTFVDIEHLTWRRALLIGLLQCVAMWPGTSRSMMTIIGGMLVGLRPKHAAEFSFLLGIPTLGGACVYEAYGSFVGGDAAVLDALGPTEMVVGAVAAFISAALAVKWLIGYLSRHGLALFGWYRILVAGVFAVLILRGILPSDAPIEQPVEPLEVPTAPD